MADLILAIEQLLRARVLFDALKRRNLDMDSKEYVNTIGKTMGSVNEALGILNSYITDFEILLSGTLDVEHREWLAGLRRDLLNIRDVFVIDFTRSQNSQKLVDAARDLKTVYDRWSKLRAELLLQSQLKPALQAIVRKAA